MNKRIIGVLIEINHLSNELQKINKKKDLKNLNIVYYMQIITDLTSELKELDNILYDLKGLKNEL